MNFTTLTEEEINTLISAKKHLDDVNIFNSLSSNTKTDLEDLTKRHSNKVEKILEKYNANIINLTNLKTYLEDNRNRYLHGGDEEIHQTSSQLNSYSEPHSYSRPRTHHRTHIDLESEDEIDFRNKYRDSIIENTNIEIQNIESEIDNLENLKLEIMEFLGM